MLARYIIFVLVHIHMLTADRAGIREPALVERVALRMRTCMARVLAINHPTDSDLCATLLAWRMDLRALNALHHERLAMFTVNGHSVNSVGLLV